MENLLSDVDFLFEKIEKLDSSRKASYLKWRKNLLFKNDTTNDSLNKQKEKLIQSQYIFESKLQDELMKINSINIPIIGFKGIFIKEKYYGNIPRTSGDIDIIVSSDKAKKVYKALKKLGYYIEPKTYYDNPIMSINLFPVNYMEKTQTLMLKNKNNKIEIDMHCNLNITNAHFIKTETKFDTSVFFNNSEPFFSYANIRTLELHDNMCVLFRHLMKHHVFYGKTQSGLATPIQHILDLAVIINCHAFNEETLKEKVIKYNVLPEAIYCLNLYNKVFINQKQINIQPYMDLLNNEHIHFKWKPIFDASLSMPVEKVMIGDFKNEFPKLQKIVDSCEKISNFKLNTLIQGLFINPFVKFLLK